MVGRRVTPGGPGVDARLGHAELIDAVGLLRAGALPSDVWSEVFGVEEGANGLPVLAGSSEGDLGGPGRDEAVRAAVRAAAQLSMVAGASLADVLERVASTLRDEASARLARDVAMAGPRASAAVLLWLPVGGLALAMVVDGGAARVLFLTPVGWVLAALAAGLTLGGRAWMRSLLRTAEAAGTGGGHVAMALALTEAAVGAGLDVSSAIGVAGECLGGDVGPRLRATEQALARGEAWAPAWSRAGPDLAPLERALRHAWRAGASPVPALRAGADALAESSRAQGARAAAQMEVRATLPLAVCLLPAFVLVGVVPLVVSVAISARVDL